MDEKNSQFILLKIPPNLVRLLGKIHALSIEVLATYCMAYNGIVNIPEPLYNLTLWFHANTDKSGCIDLH